ncbi:MULTISPECIES: NAD(P)-dependent oxidoreductase [Vibrio]|uniref:NAD-binding protein n=2 Tax=Vibrio TaxID=662 RepID=A0A7X4RT04_9VIBR|nr:MULTISPECIES: NAD(P)-dependent oxidoreductase [Vibrio]MBF9003205.1 NAD(P)-dependent oxidoreductase [Vibrio nitrifigilis]MZI91928.1 NAD-binding protein [Vibrio eleionomae]
MKNVAFLGLGAMGVRMAANILKAGYQVTVWNRTPSKAEQLVINGAKLAETPRQAAQNADVVIAMVRDDHASKEVWLDPDTGAFNSMKQGATAIDSSTLSVKWVKELHQHASERNIPFIEAPVSGTRPQAESGQLIYLVGGTQEAYESSKELLETMGSVINYTGEMGNGALAKLCTNTLLGMQVATLAELISTLQRQQDSDVEKIISALSSTATWSASANSISTLMLKQIFAPMFPVELIEKDFSYMLEATGHTSPVIEAARDVFRKGIDTGIGDENMTAVIKLYQS